MNQFKPRPSVECVSIPANVKGQSRIAAERYIDTAVLSTLLCTGPGLIYATLPRNDTI